MTQTANKTNVIDRLRSIAKKPAAAKSSALVYEGELPEADRFLELNALYKKTERELGLLRERIRHAMDRWYAERLANGGYESSVRALTDGGVLRISYQHRYSPLPADREEDIRAIVGDKFERYFTVRAGLRIRKDVAEDTEALNLIVAQLSDALGAEIFDSIFESELTLQPTRAFTERRYSELSAETNAALNLAGVHQVVVMTEGK